MRKVIIDTDPGVDDALALIYAHRAGMDIHAITTVCGNVPLLNTTANARYILRELLKSDVHIYSGSERPLKVDPVESKKTHGECGLGEIEVQTNPNYLNAGAVGEIIRAAEEYGNDISIITLGPLTNIAHAIKKNGEVMRRIKCLYAMGGAINTYGNANRVAEFNFWADPHAAREVLNSGMNITLVTANICRRFLLTEGHLERASSKDIYIPIKRMMAPFMRDLDTVQRGGVLYDPLTVGVFLKPDRMKTERMDIQIETEGVLTRGMCVPENRPAIEKNPNVNVVLDIDADFYLRHFLDTVFRQ